MSNLLLLPLRRFSPHRYRPGGLGNWSGHLPFAADLIADLRPQTFVELGTHFGESYFGVCQAVRETNAPTQCVAIDTWQGDEHAGFYDDAVYREVESYNTEHYSRFSKLLRSTFDAATANFGPESIDVLHIDGLHTYDAVKHDFDNWLPKIRPGGIVLLHDIQVLRQGFEVWRFWEELTRHYQHFSFQHCWGLGLMQKPGPPTPSRLIGALLNADRTTAELIRRQYEDAAELLEQRKRTPGMLQLSAQAGKPYLQIFPVDSDDSVSEATSVLSTIESGTWQTHVLTLSHGAPGGLIRFDPIDRPAMIEIFSLVVRDDEGKPLAGLENLHCVHDLLPVGSQYFSSGAEPQFHVPIPGAKMRPGPIQFEILMRVVFEFGAVRGELESPALKKELLDTQAKLAGAAAELTRLQALLPQLTRERTEEKRQWDSTAGSLRADRLRLERDYAHMTRHAAELKASEASQRARAEEMERSQSWRLTAPLRKVAERMSPRELPSAKDDARPPDAGKLAEIGARLERFVETERMAGAVLLISHRGTIVAHHAFGWVDREARIPMRLDALFYVLSMTKAVTCATLLTLVEEGKVTLDDPIERWLPEYKNLCFADRRKPAFAPRLSQCMSHSAGLQDSFPESFLKMRYNMPEFVSVGARNSLGYEPGEGWAYCNLGFAIVGRIIELASQRPFLEVVRERIFRPAGMSNSFFQVQGGDAERLAAIYKWQDNQLVPDAQAPFANLPDYAGPENGLMISALDLWRFYEMIRQGGVAGGNRVLSETNANAMMTVQTGKHNAGFLPGMGYGYGLSIVTDPNGMFRHHSPGTFGHGSYYQEHAWVDPAKGISALLFQHTRAEGMIVTPEVEEVVSLFGALK